jgi:vacuolar-type H+-ATPase subunit I/STV1
MALNLSEIEKTNGVFKQLLPTIAHAPAAVADPASIIENVLGFPRGMVFYGQIDCTKPEEIESKLPYLMEAHLNPPNPLVSGHHGVFGTLQGLNASFGGYIEKVKDLEQQKQDLQNQLNNRPNNSAELQRLKDENLHQSQEIQKLNTDLTTKNTDLQQKDVEIASLKTQLAASPTQAALNAANTEIAKLKAENEELKKENAKLKDAANDVVDPKKLKLFYTQVRTVQQQIAELLIQKHKAKDVHGGVVENVMRAQQATALAVLATFNSDCVTQRLAMWLRDEAVSKTKCNTS